MQLLPGLTAIVGPNGCGKSNIVEAFRWIMGESSARALRGGDSDDLIFAGTLARPARNLIEVSLRIEGAQGLASPPHDDDNTLEILRTAKRGTGSDFRINGKAARAHDVTQIFADLSLGGRSLAVVSQNRIGSLIEAKPIDRRSLLENAAGISGLHFRRRDAELKLRQAEVNRQRASDGLQQLGERRDALEAQSAAAMAYRHVVGTIRQLEARIYAVQLARAEAQIEENTAAIKCGADEVAASEAELVVLQARRAAEGDKATHLASDTDAARNGIETCRIAIERARHMAAQSETTRLRLAEQLTHLQTERTRLLARLDDLARQDDARAETLEILNTRLRDMPAICDRLKEEEATSRRDYDHACQMRQAAELAWHQARAESDELRHQRNASAKHLASCESALADCRARLETERGFLPDPDALDALFRDVTNASRERDHLQELKDTHASALQEASQRCEADSKELEVLEDRIAAIRQDIERIAARRASLAAQADDLQARLDSATADMFSTATLVALEDDLVRARETEANLQARETQLRADVAAAKDARAACQLACDAHDQRYQFLSHQTHAASTRLEAVTARIESESDKIKALQAALPPEASLDEKFSRLAAARSKRDGIEATIREREDALRTLSTRMQEANAEVLRIESAHICLSAERRGLTVTLDAPEGTNSLLELLKVPENMVTAVAAALQHGVDARLDTPDAPRQWMSLPPKSCGPLPAQVDSLGSNIPAPDALRSLMDATGLVSSPAQGDALQPTLKPGQILVSQEGGIWRWDGYRQAGGLPSEAAQRLHAKVRDAAIRQEIASLEQQRRSASEAQDRAQAAHQEGVAHVAELRLAYETAQADLALEEQQMARLTSERDQTEAAITSAHARLDDLTLEAEGLGSQHHAAQAALKELSSFEVLAADRDGASRQYETLEQTHNEATSMFRAALDARIQAEHALTRARATDEAARARHRDLATSLKHCDDELRALSQQDSAPQLTSLTARHEALKTGMTEHARQLSACQRDFDETARLAAQGAEAVAMLEGQLRTLQDRHLTHSTTIAALSEQEAVLARNRDAAAAHFAALPALPDLSEVSSAVETARSAERSMEARHNASRAEKDAAAIRFRDDSAARDGELSRGEFLAAQIVSCEEDIARLDERLLLLTEEQKQLEANDGPSDASVTALDVQLAEAIAQHEELKCRLHASQELMTGLDRAISLQDTTLRVATTRIDTAQQKLAEARKLHERLLDASAPAENVPKPEDFSERQEQSLRRELNLSLQKRDQIGAVNLLAEEEYQATCQQIDEAQGNIDEIHTAIARLQSKIGELNHEGRKKLKATFREVDQHFQRLFTRVFGGGKANLALVGSDDPLEAGLEIYAQPPGKKLSTLSLLSGGEQALTALSLLFATFSCQPAPICILDEVDAPLDEANTIRLCTLVRDMTTTHGVQFLIVTHQQVTMAHMDRLYGVTMQERGVSRLLAVDLSHAVTMAETLQAN